MSQSGVPLFHQVIPHINVLTKALDDARDDLNNHVTVRMAAVRGITMLNKYYSKTDESVMYRVAMSKYIILCLQPLPEAQSHSHAPWP